MTSSEPFALRIYRPYIFILTPSRTSLLAVSIRGRQQAVAVPAQTPLPLLATKARITTSSAILWTRQSKAAPTSRTIIQGRASTSTTHYWARNSSTSFNSLYLLLAAVLGSGYKIVEKVVLSTKWHQSSHLVTSQPAVEGGRGNCSVV